MNKIIKEERTLNAFVDEKGNLSSSGERQSLGNFVKGSEIQFMNC
jgi:hypothetical protein